MSSAHAKNYSITCLALCRRLLTKSTSLGQNQSSPKPMKRGPSWINWVVRKTSVKCISSQWQSTRLKHLLAPDFILPSISRVPGRCSLNTVLENLLLHTDRMCLRQEKASSFLAEPCQVTRSHRGAAWVSTSSMPAVRPQSSQQGYESSCFLWILPSLSYFHTASQLAPWSSRRRSWCRTWREPTGPSVGTWSPVLPSRPANP